MVSKISLKLFLILNLCLYANFSFSKPVDVDLQATPPVLNFNLQNGPGLYGPHNHTQGVNLDLRTDENEWAVSCRAEPLVSQKGPFVIPPERIFVSMEGHDNIPLNNVADIVYGSAPLHQSVCIALLHFKIQTLKSDVAGKYNGVIHLYYNGNEMATIIIHLHIRQSFRYSIHPQVINFGQALSPGLKYSNHIKAIIHSNGTGWKVFCEAGDLESGNHTIQANRLFVANRSVNKNDYHDLAQYLMLYESTKEKDHQLDLIFKVETNWKDYPGTYTGYVNLRITESNEIITLPVTLVIPEHIALVLSHPSIHFEATRGQGVCNADKSVSLIVGSNYHTWNVVAEATDLTNNRNRIPKEQLSIASTGSSGPGFEKLDKKVQVANGSAQAPAEMAKLSFQLKYYLQTVPGFYEGKIRFSLLGTP